MRNLIPAALLCAAAAIAGGPAIAAERAECEEMTKATIISWNPFGVTEPLFSAVHDGLFAERCYDVEIQNPGQSFSSFGAGLVRSSTSGDIIIAVAIGAAMQYIASAEEHGITDDMPRIVGINGISGYALYQREGADFWADVEAGKAVHIASSFCAWTGDVTEFSQEGRKETPSALSETLLRFHRLENEVRTAVGGEPIKLYCHSSPSDANMDAPGIHVDHVGFTSKRLNLLISGRYDYALMVPDMVERYTDGDDELVLEQVISVKEMNVLPEYALVAMDSCTQNEKCAEFIRTINEVLRQEIEKRRKNPEFCVESMRALAARSQKGSIVGIESREDAEAVCAYSVGHAWRECIPASGLRFASILAGRYLRPFVDTNFTCIDGDR